MDPPLLHQTHCGHWIWTTVLSPSWEMHLSDHMVEFGDGLFQATAEVIVPTMAQTNAPVARLRNNDLTPNQMTGTTRKQ